MVRGSLTDALLQKRVITNAMGNQRVRFALIETGKRTVSSDSP